jgi:hypothetical protein
VSETMNLHQVPETMTQHCGLWAGRIMSAIVVIALVADGTIQLFACESASNIGSDSFLMQFRIRVVLSWGESAPCSKHFAAPVWCRPDLLWRVRFAIPTELLSPSGHHKVFVFVRHAELFRAAFIAITGVGSGTFRCQGGWSSS